MLPLMVKGVIVISHSLRHLSDVKAECDHHLSEFQNTNHVRQDLGLAEYGAQCTCPDHQGSSLTLIDRSSGYALISPSLSSFVAHVNGGTPYKMHRPMRNLNLRTLLVLSVFSYRTLSPTKEDGMIISIETDIS